MAPSDMLGQRLRVAGRWSRQDRRNNIPSRRNTRLDKSFRCGGGQENE